MVQNLVMEGHIKLEQHRLNFERVTAVQSLKTAIIHQSVT